MKSFGTIFLGNDDYVHWVAWAKQFSNSIFPDNTRHYPQLMPVIWAYSFLFSNNLVFMAKGIMPFFIIIYAIIFLRLGLILRKSSILIAVPISILITFTTFSSFYHEGYVDFVSALFGCLSIYCLLIARQKKYTKTNLFKFLALGALFVIGAGLTKQAGYFIIFIYPVLVYIFFKNRNLKLSYLIGYILMVFVCISPLFFYQSYLMNIGENTSNFKLVIHDIYHGKQYLQRVFQAGMKFMQYTILGMPNIEGVSYSTSSISSIFNYFLSQHPFRFVLMLFSPFIFLVLAFYGIKDKLSRTFFLSIGLPYGIIWALFFCYSERHISIALPFVALLLAAGIDQIICNTTFVKKLFKLNFMTFFLFCFLLLSYLQMPYSYDKFEIMQDEFMKEVSFSKLNQKLYNFHEFVGFDENNKILSGYEGLGYLPKLKRYAVGQSFGKYSGSKVAQETYLKNIQSGSIKYILYPHDVTRYSKGIALDISNNLNTGKYVKIFSQNDFSLLKVNE